MATRIDQRRPPGRVSPDVPRTPAVSNAGAVSPTTGAADDGVPTRARDATATRGRPSRGAIALVVGIGLFAALIVSIVVAVTIGPVPLTPGDVWGTILHHVGLGEQVLPTLRDGIVWQLRLPRLLTAAAVGAGLALCGVVMQALTRNPLADPYLLGLSSGASLGAVAVILLGAAVFLPAAAFVGALAALAATLGLARALGSLSPTRTVLAGLAVSSLATAITSFVIFASADGDAYREILGWLMGSLSGTTWTSVVITTTAFVVIGLPIAFTGRLLDGMLFGDTAATSIGISVERTRWLLLGATALVTGAMVGVSGSIGFVGLIVPHAVRLLVGADNRTLLPLSALTGAVFLVWADTIARTVFAPQEIPVGIVTALVGAPVFALLLWRRKSDA